MSQHPLAIEGRRRKARELVGLIDAGLREQGIDPRAVDATELVALLRAWTEASWQSLCQRLAQQRENEAAAAQGLPPMRVRRQKPPSRETRAMVLEIIRARGERQAAGVDVDSQYDWLDALSEAS